MYPHICHVFIDGGYLRTEAAERWNTHNVNPRNLATRLVGHPAVQSWAADSTTRHNALLGRVTYYDALPDEDQENGEATDLQAYWRTIELLSDVHLGFGALRGLGRRVRQKGVDTLIAVDMLVGAFSGIFDMAVLVSGDADFIPVVEEVHRRGVMVAVAGVSTSVSPDLRRVADRYIELDSQWLTSMAV